MKLIKNVIDLKTIGDFCYLQQGLQINKSERLSIKEDDSYLYITVDFLKRNDNHEYIKNPRPSVMCNENDILVSRTGTVGNVISGINGVFHNNFFKLLLDNNSYPKFFYYYLKSNKIKQEMIKRANGAVIPDLKHSEFLSIKFPNLTIDNQIRTSDQIKKMEENLNNIKTLLEKIEIRNQYYADNFLSGKLSINENNEIYENNEWKDLIINGINKKAMKFAKRVKLEDFKYQTSKGVAGENGYLEIGDIDVKTKKYDITKKEKLSVSGCRFCEKNILVISTVRPQRLGYTITQEDLFISNAFTTIDISKNKILEYVIKTNDFMKHIIENSEGAIYPTIKESKLLNFEFFYDETKEIQIFNFLKKLDIEKDKVSELLHLEEQRFEWLSDKLLSGEYIIED